MKRRNNDNNWRGLGTLPGGAPSLGGRALGYAMNTKGSVMKGKKKKRTWFAGFPLLKDGKYVSQIFSVRTVDESYTYPKPL